MARSDAASALVETLVTLAVLLYREPRRAITPATADEVTRSLATALGFSPREPAAEPRPPTLPADEAAAASPSEATTATGRSAGVTSDGASTVGDVSAGGASDQAIALPAPVPEPRQVSTRLGGAFYLLALLDRLDLPASACGPGEPGSLLTRWGVLALVVRGLGADPADPLLELLDELAGSSPDPPPIGESWAYRRPRAAGEWLGPSHAPWTWWCDGDRVVVTDPGVAPGAAVIADVPFAGPDGVPGDGPERWGCRVAGLLEALLGRVGLDAGIVRVPATVELTDLSVRVCLGLDDVDLDVRRAGLDRDPGWVPALGRSVELVFA